LVSERLAPKSVLPVPDGPGLGVSIDRAAMARMHRLFLDQGAMASNDGGYGAAFRQQ
jgi:glucarate dehydratase